MSGPSNQTPEWKPPSGSSSPDPDSATGPGQGSRASTPDAVSVVSEASFGSFRSHSEPPGDESKLATNQATSQPTAHESVVTISEGPEEDGLGPNQAADAAAAAQPSAESSRKRQGSPRPRVRTPPPGADRELVEMHRAYKRQKGEQERDGPSVGTMGSEDPFCSAGVRGLFGLDPVPDWRPSPGGD